MWRPSSARMLPAMPRARVNGIELCRVIRAEPRWADTPVVILTGHTDHEAVNAALDAGVQLIGPECAIPLKTKLENLIEIPKAIEDWVAERGEN